MPCSPDILFNWRRIESGLFYSFFVALGFRFNILRLFFSFVKTIFFCVAVYHNENSPLFPISFFHKERISTERKIMIKAETITRSAYFAAFRDRVLSLPCFFFRLTSPRRHLTSSSPSTVTHLLKICSFTAYL